jgi:hypothetical protein
MSKSSSEKSLWALPAAGLLFFLGCLVRGAHVFPSSATAPRFAAWTARPAYVAGYFVLVGAVTLSVLGYFALARRLGGKLAFTGMVLSILGMQFLLVLFGGAIIMSPALGAAWSAGTSNAADIAQKALAGPTVGAIAAMIVVGIVGHALFAVAIWRSRSLSRLSVVPLVLAPICLCLPFYFPIELGGGVLWAVAGLLLANPSAETAGDQQVLAQPPRVDVA